MHHMQRFIAAWGVLDDGMTDKQFAAGYDTGFTSGYQCGLIDGWAKGFDTGLKEGAIEEQ